MRIAQVSPLFESVPPHRYGGTERIVSFLTEELVRRGHEVTLFASGDSLTRARLIPACPRSLRLDPSSVEHMSHHMILLDQVFQRLAEFDVVHFHIDYLHFPLSRRFAFQRLTTLHGRLDIPDLQALYHHFSDEPLVSISNSQRAPLPEANWMGTVHHGLPRDLFTFHEKPGQYLAFVGRISPEKGVVRAIEIAKRCGIPLRVAAKVDVADRAYYESIRPQLHQPGVEFIGEINDREKNELLGHAMAMLFPVDWPEPFGIVMIESLACGTPVVAWPCGSVPEVLRDGVTGYVCNEISTAVAAVHHISRISRADCRREFESRFSVERMANDYLDLYERLISRAEQAKVEAHGRDHSRTGSILHPGHLIQN